MKYSELVFVAQIMTIQDFEKTLKKLLIGYNIRKILNVTLFEIKNFSKTPIMYVDDCCVSDPI